MHNDIYCNAAYNLQMGTISMSLNSTSSQAEVFKHFSFNTLKNITSKLLVTSANICSYGLNLSLYTGLEIRKLYQ
jgi:hypothetical protein